MTVFTALPRLVFLDSAVIFCIKLTFSVILDFEKYVISYYL